MRLISKETAEHYRWGDGCDGWHLVKSKSLSVIQELVPSGCSEVRHYHRKSEQFFFILSGIAILEVNGVTHRLREHEGFHVAAGLKHQLRNEHEESLSFIVTSTPPAHGDRVEQLQ